MSGIQRAAALAAGHAAERDEHRERPAGAGESRHRPRRNRRLIHGSVCRDYLEPATACGVHYELGLPQECLVYDVSNACLGMLNGMIQVANMIELGQIRAGLVVGTEDSRQLVESTIAAAQSATRR